MRLFITKDAIDFKGRKRFDSLRQIMHNALVLQK